MHPILSLDTATRSATVTLGTSDAYTIVHSDPEARNSRDLMQLIAGILAPCGGLAQTQLEAVALNRGPGSYTGARIGASVIQGIAYAKGLPVVLLTTFELLLLRAESLGLLSAQRDIRRIVLVVESKVGEYFGLSMSQPISLALTKASCSRRNRSCRPYRSILVSVC